jgi:hypothetical protein
VKCYPLRQAGPARGRTQFRHRLAALHDGPLGGGTARIYPERAGMEPRTITLAGGCTEAEPWPHQWLDYQRQPDGSYRYTRSTETRP